MTSRTGQPVRLKFYRYFLRQRSKTGFAAFIYAVSKNNSLYEKIISALPLPGVAFGHRGVSDDEVSQNLIVINGGEHFLSLDGLARAGKISVLAPAPWRVTKAVGDTWFRLSATEGPAGYSEVELSLDENPGAARSAQLAFACGDAIVPFRLSQGALSAGYDSPDYYFYVTFGTMPTLYAGIHLLSHDKPGYVFYSRSKTFDPVPRRVPGFRPPQTERPMPRRPKWRLWRAK